MAEYKGKEVKLDDPFRLPQGSDKKFGVYVKNPKSGNVIMVKFGDPNLSIKRDDPDRLKNFRARHNCDQKTDKTTPGYWSCKFWEKDSPVSKLLKQGKVSESDLKFKGKEMKDHLDKAKAKLKAEYGSLDNVDYKKAMKVVGATLAARLSARGMIKRSDGSTKKGKLGKPEEEMLTCGCDQITEETRKFIKGWVNPRTKKIIAWNKMQPYHAKHIYDNLSKYGLTTNDLIDHYIAVLSKRSPKYKPDREELEKRFEQIGKNNMLADRDETLEYPAIKKGWVAFTLEDSAYGKVMALRGITKDIKKSSIMILDKFKTFKDLDRILITNYKDTKFAEYTGKTKNDDERYSSNSEAMKFLFGRRPKRREPKTEIGRTMAMFREYVEMTEGEWKDEKDEREHNKLFMKSLKVMPKSPQQKKIIQQMNALRKKNGLELLDEAKRVPKTRKNQDPDTHSDLYTDEDPRGTIHGLGFKDVETAEASVRKIKASDRTHAHKIQAAIAMEQRAKVMKKTAEAAVYRKFIEQMKKKTKEMNEEAYLPGQATTSHGGKSGRGGKPGPRMSRQRKNRAAVLDHLILNGIQVLNQPADVRQKGSSDTFVVAKKDLKRATDVVDDYFSKKYVRMHMAKNQLRRENYKIIAEDVNEVYKDSGLGDWFGKGGGGGKEEGGWDRYNTAGERIGKCGDAKKGAAYSACLSAEKAKQLGKEGIADFVKRKRAAQKKAGDKAKGGESKKGQKPVMVKTGAKGLDKKNESYMSFKSFISEGENKPNNPELWKKAIAKAKEKFDVYPSAYANAWASKWYKGKGGTWSKK